MFQSLPQEVRAKLAAAAAREAQRGARAAADAEGASAGLLRAQLRQLHFKPRGVEESSGLAAEPWGQTERDVHWLRWQSIESRCSFEDGKSGSNMSRQIRATVRQTGA